MTAPIPSIDQCLGYFDQFAMLDNIRAHSLLVARVTEVLIDGLNKADKAGLPRPDREEGIAGALLHDIAKTQCIATGCHHAEVGRQICEELGYPKIGEIVAEHVVLKNFTTELYKQGIFGSKETVFYADKRVLHDQIVPLAKRLEYILERYGNGSKLKENLIRQNFQRTIDFESYLFSFLDFSPEALQDQLPLQDHAAA